MALSAGGSTALYFQLHPREFLSSRAPQPISTPTLCRRPHLPSSKPISLGRQVICMSLNISKEDKPVSENTSSLPESTDGVGEPGETPETDEEEAIKEAAKRRLEEKFAILNTGIHECRSCGYKYNEKIGDPSYPIPPGLEFAKLPDDWRCPTCGAAKSFFDNKSVEIAGFAENQQFGLGGNSLTSGQKAVLIYGSLIFFFVLFLSGYFIQ
ncbi:Rubredoxin [Nymphaea thermarum]|nr:Rubredoxin [Nymphaea thermarum]